MSIEQGSEERVDKVNDRVARAARTRRWGPLEDTLTVQIIKRIHNEKCRAKLLDKKDLNAGKVRSVCMRFESAKTAANA